MRKHLLYINDDQFILCINLEISDLGKTIRETMGLEPLLLTTII